MPPSAPSACSRFRTMEDWSTLGSRMACRHPRALTASPLTNRSPGRSARGTPAISAQSVPSVFDAIGSLRPESLRYTEEAMPEQEQEANLAESKHGERRGLAVGLASLFFVLLQSACTAFFAISGLRLLIGLGSLAAATAGLNFLAALHFEALRIPMEMVAIAGSVVNLLAVWRVRRLRARPSSQWRMKPATQKQLRSESWQIALAIVTLLLVAVEWGFHIYLHGAV